MAYGREVTLHLDGKLDSALANIINNSKLRLLRHHELTDILSLTVIISYQITFLLQTNCHLNMSHISSALNITYFTTESFMKWKLLSSSFICTEVDSKLFEKLIWDFYLLVFSIVGSSTPSCKISCYYFLHLCWYQESRLGHYLMRRSWSWVGGEGV